MQSSHYSTHSPGVARATTRLLLAFGLPLMVSACDPGRDDSGPAPSPYAALSAIERIADAPDIAVSEYAARRTRLAERLPQGIVLLHARPAEKAMEQWGFVQDPAFAYFTGLTETPGAIFAMDGAAGEAHLFLPPAPQSFGMTVEGLTAEPGLATAERLGMTTARPWADFNAFVRGRLRAAATRLYVDESRRPEATGMPLGMRPVAGDRTLWHAALEEAFPSARIASAKNAIVELRATKSDAEIALLEVNARRTVTSLQAVAQALAPGVRQRDTEAVMVAACLAAGGQGPSFWPWTMSGPNAHTGQLVSAFFRYDQGDRVVEEGDLVRVDIGCAGGGYGADVGRTLPASGRFTAGQAEAWDLLIAGYLAGLDAMVDGVAVSEVRGASAGAVRDRQSGLTTAEGVAAAEAILEGGDGTWHIHGVGVESGEDLPAVLRTGMVLAYEPGFSVGLDAFYLEDMIVVTATGHRVLSAGLPYTSAEVVDFMGGR